jgi:hypothetical protein
MIKNHLSVLYIGAADKGRLLNKRVGQRGWIVHQPAELMEALALHITSYPDIVVLDRRETPLFAREVEAHLCSLNDGVPMLDGTYYEEVESLVCAIEDRFDTFATDFCENGC